MKHAQREKTMDWTSAFIPQRCEICGRSLLPSSMESLFQTSEQLYGPLFRGLGEMYGGLMGLSPARYKSRSYTHSRNDCDYRHCGHDDCHCSCCIVDADLVVYTRVGEQRVVPLDIENSTRREREIRLELSGWATQGGRKSDLEVQSTLTPPQFTLAGCESRSVVLALRMGLGGESKEVEGRENDEAFLTAVRQLPDLDDCVVLYADLRVEGCDIRPVRIAVAVLPRDCGAYEIDCRCSCC
jgi:hypothetical protein